MREEAKDAHSATINFENFSKYFISDNTDECGRVSVFILVRKHNVEKQDCVNEHWGHRRAK